MASLYEAVLVEPVAGGDELLSADRIYVNAEELGNIDAAVGSVVEIFYIGGVMES